MTAGPLIADTGGLFRAIARRPDGRPSWPAYSRALAAASRVVAPAPALVEVDSSGRALGLVDGVVAAVAERLRVYRVLTIDHDDFGPLRVGQRFTQRLEIVP